MSVRSAKRVRCAIVSFSVALSLGAGADDPLSTHVTPALAFAPSPVRIEVHVKSHDDNRRLEIVVDSGEFRRSSTIPLAGAKAPRVHTVMYRGLPAGQYEVLVELFDQTDSVRAMERQRVDIVP